MSFAAASKVHKRFGREVTQIEKRVAHALLDLERYPEMKEALKGLHIAGAREIVLNGVNSLVVLVPRRQSVAFKALQARLLGEFEKKFSGMPVFFVTERTYIPAKSGTRRIVSQTKSFIHNAILEDIIFPAQIAGKRQRIKLDGSRHLKIILGEKDRIHTESKIELFTALYEKLCKTPVTFEYEAK